MLTFGSLFSGYGGLDLGLERAGLKCSWQVEIDEHARRILTKHWPTVPKFADVKECGKRNLKTVDLLCGGFPCQDISDAGLRVGIEGQRSGLWSEYKRIICELRPRFVLVENVSALLVQGIDRVLGDLAESGYDAEWQTIPAAAFGAYHIRNRLFILAYARSYGLDLPQILHALPYQNGHTSKVEALTSRLLVGDGERLLSECPTDRLANGFPSVMDDLKGLGNAVYPNIGEWIGKSVITYLDRIKELAA